MKYEICYVSNPKNNLESCSGITGIMKVLLSMKHETIPAHLNFTKLNPAIDLSKIPALLPLESYPWKKSIKKPRLAGVSSFGISGTDAHVLIEEPPTLPKSAKQYFRASEPELYLLKISTKTEDAMGSLIEQYVGILETTEESIADLCFSANTGRADFPIRSSVIGNKQQIIKALKCGNFVKGTVENEKDGFPNICFLFTGQGSQYLNMAHEVYQTSPVFRINFDYCANFLLDNYNLNIAEIIWKSSDNDNKINHTLYSQTSIFCVEYSLLRLWQSWGVRPNYVLGHSLGEFAAAVCVNLLTVDQALSMIAERSILIDSLPHGKMLVIRANRSSVQKLRETFSKHEGDDLMDYAAFNSNEQTVLAGDSEQILKFAAFCKESSIRCTLLDSSHAFHSKHMDAIIPEYGKAVQRILQNEHSEPILQSCKYISGGRGNVIDNPGEVLNKQYWEDHTRFPVEFLDASAKAVQSGCKIFIEIGPQPVLTALISMNTNTNFMCLPSLKRKMQDWETLLTSLGKIYTKGVNINWPGLYKFMLRKKISLPFYPFAGRKFWPELLNVTEDIIHPLLGTEISNASSSKLYQCVLNLRKHEWIKDHMIGNHIIFPGAAYLEMCLAAGIAFTSGGTVGSMQKIRHSAKIKNLKVLLPLALNESRQLQLQSVVEYETDITENSQSISVKVFAKDNCDANTDWVCHVRSCFSPVTNIQDHAIPFPLLNIIDSMSHYKANQVEMEDTYAKMAAVGLNFGPIFQSIQSAWRFKQNNSLLVKVKIPTSNGFQNDHIIHPVVLDAMLQSIVLHSTSEFNGKLCVPIKIGSFVWIANSAVSSDSFFIQVQDEKSNPKSSNVMVTNSLVALLMDSTGNLLAIMKDVEIVTTSIRALNVALEQQHNPMPNLWEENWIKQPNTQQVDIHALALPFSEEETRSFAKYNTCSTHVQTILDDLTRLGYYNILRALYDCGWKPDTQNEFLETEIFESLNINSEYRQQFGYFLRILEKAGNLKRKSPDSWQIAVLPPTRDIVLQVLCSANLSDSLFDRFNAAKLMINIGNNLSKILSGSQSALAILFPDNDNEIHVSQFYREYSELGQLTPLQLELQTSWLERYKAAARNHKAIIRILEVGAGTGFYTEALLQALDNSQIPFEYTYTDITTVFFDKAMKRFNKWKKNMKFMPLNIEEDTLSQGFVPGYYDFICGADVLHATRNIKESLRNLKMLLRQDGILDICEQIQVSPIITFIFGLLDGFWRFNDFDIRTDHCVLDKYNWNLCLNDTGFKMQGCYPCNDGSYAIIRSQNVSPEDPQLLASNNIFARKAWIIFQHSNCSYSDHFVAKMQEIVKSRRVFCIILPNATISNTKFSDECITLVAEGEIPDFDRILKDVNSNYQLEGIIYAWSLNITVEGMKSQEEVLKPLFLLAQSIQNLPEIAGIKLRVLLEDVAPLEEVETFGYPGSTICGFVKSFQSENPNISCKVIDVGPNLGPKHVHQVFFEIWKPSKEIYVAYKDEVRFVPKLSPIKHVYPDSLTLPVGTDRFLLVLPESRSITDLKFGYLSHLELKDTEVEIQIMASALNFRDIMSVIKPTDLFNDINAVGLDFAGIVKRTGARVSKWSIGDRVYGANLSTVTTLPSHINLSEDAVIRIPDDWTFCEASTLPAVGATSYQCLVEIAKVCPNDTVLIHTASGGVGLSAIQICQNIGCTIIATAGSKRKQNYLRNLGIKHIFHSRNTSYLPSILSVTNGRGVNVVLNSLTGDGFKEATLKACAKGARFVEMSKLSVWSHSEVMALRPDVEYTIADLSQVNHIEWNNYMGVLEDLLKRRVLKPIPYTRFSVLDIRQALTFMQKAKHIGKVVCVMPEISQLPGGIKVQVPLFHSNATYLITGGLGGIGFEVCQWMIKRGARYIILVGRNSPGKDLLDTLSSINNTYDANIRAVPLDISNFGQLNSLIFEQISQFGYPALRGIMHAAGTLNDGFIHNHTWDSFASTFPAKVQGTLNLHEITKSIPVLEHFVVFSSAVSQVGPPGQSNHAAANYFEDVLVHHRNVQGLTGTTINWGQWGECGVATEAVIPGVKPFSTKQGLRALEYALSTQQTRMIVFNLESAANLVKLVPSLSSYLDEHILKSTVTSSQIQISHMQTSNKFWESYQSQQTFADKVSTLKAALAKILRMVLKLEESDELDENTDFQQMGVDSLMFVEIKNELQALLADKIAINANLLKDSNTLNLLSDSVTKCIEGILQTSIDEIPSTEQVDQLITEDCFLPDNIRPSKEQSIVKVKDISCILLTGVTGALGAYILKELTNCQQVQEVFCLVRTQFKSNPETRLINCLKERGLFEKIIMSKVNCIPGNIAKPRLGLHEDVWVNLSNKLDAIIHCAANVSHVEHYLKRPEKEDVRNVNVNSVKHVLSLACSGKKLKHVFHASSMITIPDVNSNGNVSEDWPTIGDFSGVTTLAYPLSKYVGDILMKCAIVDRKIPGKVFRFPLITGDSKTGQCMIDQNHVMLRYLFMMKAGTMPSTLAPTPLLPVDLCAWASIKLFLNPDVPSDIYNICNQDPVHDSEFVNVAEKLGFNVRVVDFSEFSEKIRDLTENDSPFASFKDFYKNDEDILALYNKSPILRQWMVSGFDSKDFFVSKKLQSFLPEFYETNGLTSIDHIYRDLLYAKSQGWIEKCVN